MQDRQIGTPGKVRFSVPAGVLSILAGCLKLLVAFGIAIAILGIMVGEEDKEGVVILLAIAIPMAVMGVVAVAGGIFAVMQKSWGMSLAGSIAAVLPFSLLGAAALVLTALSRKEFA